MKSYPESPPSPERQREEDLFKLYSTAEDEVEAIMKEIGEILARAEHRGEAERQLLRTHADRLESASRNARELLNRWLTYVRELANEE